MSWNYDGSLAPLPQAAAALRRSIYKLRRQFFISAKATTSHEKGKIKST
jgi:hypothetical protein